MIETIYEGLHEYQNAMIKALTPLDADKLELRAGPELRSVYELATHIIAVRARWFYMLMNEGGDVFKQIGGWDRKGSKKRSSTELIKGLEETWEIMHEAIARWSPEEWKQTWPGEDETEPETITRQWVIWHLIEHDVYHGGEISNTLRSHGLEGLDL